MLQTNKNSVLIYVTFFYLANINKRSAAAISYNDNNQLNSVEFNYKTPNDLAIEQVDNYIKTSPNFEDICKQQAPVCGSDSRTYQNICHLGVMKTKQPNLGLLYKGKCWKEKTTLFDVINFVVKQREKGVLKKNWPDSVNRRQLSIDIGTPQQQQMPKQLLTSFFSSPAEADTSLAIMTRQNQDLRNELERQKIILIEVQKKALLEEQRNITKEILSGFDKRLEELRASIKEDNKTYTEKRAQTKIKNSHERYESDSKRLSSEKEEIRLMKIEIENYKKNMARLQVELEFQKLQRQKHIEQLKKELARQRDERKNLFKLLREALEKPHKDHHHHKTKPQEKMLRYHLEKQKEKEEDEKRTEKNHQQLHNDFEKKTADFEKELKELQELYKKNQLLKGELEKQTQLKKSQYETLKIQLQKNLDNPNKDSVHNIHETTTNFWF